MNRRKFAHSLAFVSNLYVSLLLCAGAREYFASENTHFETFIGRSCGNSWVVFNQCKIGWRTQAAVPCRTNRGPAWHHHRFGTIPGRKVCIYSGHIYPLLNRINRRCMLLKNYVIIYFIMDYCVVAGWPWKFSVRLRLVAMAFAGQSNR